MVLPSFEGLEFEIPRGVSWVWDKAGEHLLKTYAPDGEYGTWGWRYGQGQSDMSKGKTFIQQAPPTPAIIPASKEDWEKEGKRFCQVRRYKVLAKLIPRESLITIASERGVSQQRLVEYTNKKNIDVEEIADDINSLSVPEDIKYPTFLETENEQTK